MSITTELNATTDLNCRLSTYRSNLRKLNKHTKHRNTKFALKNGTQCSINYFPSPAEGVKIRIDVLVKKKTKSFFNQSYQRLSEEAELKEGILNFVVYNPPKKELSQGKITKDIANSGLYEVTLFKNEEAFKQRKNQFIESYPWAKPKWYEWLLL